MEIRFKLNPKNEKDKVIIDVLSGEYSPSETIKNILYKMGIGVVEGQQAVYGGRSDDINASTELESSPKADSQWIRVEESCHNSKCQLVGDEDIMNYFR